MKQAPNIFESSPREVLKRELSGKKGGCFIAFDLDDTVLKTSAKIIVQYDNGETKTFSTEEYGKLDPTTFTPDFSEFKDPNKLTRESVVMERNMRLFLMMQEMTKAKMMEDGSRLVILTARSDFTSKEQVINYLAKLGVDVDRVHFERAGNIGIKSTSENKKKIVERYLEENSFASVILVDDSISNLDKIMSIADRRDDTDIFTYCCKDDGVIEEHKSFKSSLGHKDSWAKRCMDSAIKQLEVSKSTNLEVPELKDLVEKTRRVLRAPPSNKSSFSM